MMPVRAMHTAPVEIWPRVRCLQRRIAKAARLFLFLDFDGTLAPIVPTPALATMPSDLANILRSLCTRPEVVVAVISGRSLEDLVTKVGLPVVYAGNHGLEIRGMGLEYTAPVHPQTGVQLSDCCDVLRGRLERFPGAWIEYKQQTASLHVRQLARFQLPALEDLVRSTMTNYPKLQLRHGKEVFEIRPNIAWNKGCAARWILHQMEGNDVGAICIGDDSTDEDMFRELNNGVTIRIGGESNSSAQYWMAVTEVARFLSFLLETLEQRRSR
jgi:trehalose 6-phosphate phosphatase